MTRVVDHRWYGRNKHIFPASMWTEFDPNTDYTNMARQDIGGNAFFRLSLLPGSRALAAPGLEIVYVLSESSSENYRIILYNIIMIILFTSFFFLTFSLVL